MSAPRYRLTLSVGEDRISLRLKTCLGDHAGLVEELRLLVEQGSIDALAQGLEEKSGGAERMRERWHRSMLRLLDGEVLPSPRPGMGFCDGCGDQVIISSLSEITTSNLAGVVLCPNCIKP